MINVNFDDSNYKWDHIIGLIFGLWLENGIPIKVVAEQGKHFLRIELSKINRDWALLPTCFRIITTYQIRACASITYLLKKVIDAYQYEFIKSI